MPNHCLAALIALAVLIAPCAIRAQEPPRDFTCFQSGSPYAPDIDIASDLAITYGVGHDFAERVAQWKRHGYNVSLMTGIAWGGYGAYYGSGDDFKRDEVQTDKSGKLFMHGNSTTVGYNVPSPEYVQFIKDYIDPALDCDILGVYLEEPEFWANTGWSESFKKEWQRFYGEPWQAPDSSPDAQYRASKLKYELYFNALKEVFAHIDKRAAERGVSIECHVPTHSLINYAQWRIVSPESHLIDIPQLDGYIAQVWTGTARSRNMYRGVGKERTFETAYLEYGQMLGMVRPTGKKVWFLADPIEDNPNYDWADYKVNYECTLVASLLWPEVSRYEVMPWPGRIFRGKYPRYKGAAPDDRVAVPAEYSTQLLTVINALNHMEQSDVKRDTGSQGVGVIVSDTLMFQRSAPEPSDAALGSFYALSLPLVKHGIPGEVVQLENAVHPNCFKPYRVLLLTYEGQKPLRPEYHAALAQWVREGGGLIYVGDGSDPYHDVREWWNAQGTEEAKAYDDLFERLGVTEDARTAPQAIGKGFVRVLEERPRDMQREEDGAEKVIGLVREMFAAQGQTLETQNYLRIQRGPYVIAAVLDESVSDQPLTLTGNYVDLFDARLPVVVSKTLNPNERALLYDLDWGRGKDMPVAKVVAAATRVRDERVEQSAFTFTTRGPVDTHARVRILLPGKPASVAAEPSVPFEHVWDADSSTLLLSFDNKAEDIKFELALPQ
ncbi:MAG: hypothetical protein GWP08_15495 [Nitrospiraceae bacterium]|nr:hypothetical protein [Nitrospiraceae bacterium]